MDITGNSANRNELTEYMKTQIRDGTKDPAELGHRSTLYREGHNLQVSDEEIRELVERVLGLAVPGEGFFLPVESYTKRPSAIPWLLRGFIEMGIVTSLVGPSDLGKTCLLLWLMICRALGKDFFGIPVAEGASCLVTCEDQRRQIERKLYTWQYRHPTLDWDLVSKRLYFHLLVGHDYPFIDAAGYRAWCANDRPKYLARDILRAAPETDLAALDTVTHFTHYQFENEVFGPFHAAANLFAEELSQKRGAPATIIPVHHTLTKTEQKTIRPENAMGGTSFFRIGRAQINVEHLTPAYAKSERLNYAPEANMDGLVLWKVTKGNDLGKPYMVLKRELVKAPEDDLTMGIVYTRAPDPGKVSDANEDVPGKPFATVNWAALGLVWAKAKELLESAEGAPVTRRRLSGYHTKFGLARQAVDGIVDELVAAACLEWDPDVKVKGKGAQALKLGPNTPTTGISVGPPQEVHEEDHDVTQPF